MSKIFQILYIFIILLSNFAFYTKAAKADTPQCGTDKMPITWGNPVTGTFGTDTFFHEGSGDLTLQFTINNENTQRVLTDSQAGVFLHLPGGLAGSDNNDTTYELIPGLTGNTFNLTIKQTWSQAGRGEHSGELWWQVVDPNNPVPPVPQPLCNGVKYKVGVGTQCTTTTGKEIIPPGEKITVRFLGIAKQKYKATFIKTKPRPTEYTKLAETNTDDNGSGEFKDLQIPGQFGVTGLIRIEVVGSSINTCTVGIEISATAPPRVTSAPAPTGPITPTPIIPITVVPGYQCSPADYTSGKCTNARGVLLKGCSNATVDNPNNPKEPGVNTNPGIVTAIGCIHTNPAEFVKDLLKWVIGIGGGIAFLMMVLGAFQMLTSDGNPETLQTGRDRLTSAVIGLLFIIFSVLLLQIIGIGILNIPGFQK